MRPKTTWLTLELVCVVAYVWYCWSVSRMVDESEPSGAGFYYGLSRICFGIARWFGHVGLESELKYHEIIEENRTI